MVGGNRSRALLLLLALGSPMCLSPRGLGAEPSKEEVQILKRTSDSFRAIAKKVAAAVVNVRSTLGSTSELARRTGRSGSPSELPPGFRDFFEHFGIPFEQGPSGPQIGFGSGFLIDGNGHVVTNHHVIDGASKIAISFGDSTKEYKGVLVGSDPRTDLAVLRVTGIKPPAAATWADYKTVEVGDWAIAIGSPFALGTSVTVGIVSAKGRRGEILAGTEFSGDLLQTDAAINPGNSGGPLCDLQGNVIGVNTAIYTRSGGYMGIGFAIPSSVAEEIASNLIRDGKIVRGWLGVVIQPLDEVLAKDLGIQHGALIHEVTADSPAARAGLVAGEVIVELDGKSIEGPDDLQKKVSGARPGQTVRLGVVSYATKASRTVSVKIGTLPDTSPRLASAERGESERIGLSLAKAPGASGLVVQGVVPGSIAAQSGLEAGDILLRANRKSIESVAQFQKLLAHTSSLALEVKRGERTLFFQLDLPAQVGE
jgi:serine protease Do